MAISEDIDYHPVARTIVTGPELIGAVTLVRTITYTNSVTGEAHAIRKSKQFAPGDNISNLPQAVQDFITNQRTFFGV